MASWRFDMKTNVIRFTFAPSTDLAEVEATLQLAILASEGLCGEARVRLEVSYFVDSPRSVILIDGGTPAGGAVIRIFAALVMREFGADVFRVERVNQIPASSPARAGTQA